MGSGGGTAGSGDNAGQLSGAIPVRITYVETRDVGQPLESVVPAQQHISLCPDCARQVNGVAGFEAVIASYVTGFDREA